MDGASIENSLHIGCWVGTINLNIFQKPIRVALLNTNIGIISLNIRISRNGDLLETEAENAFVVDGNVEVITSLEGKCYFWGFVEGRII